MAKNMVVFRSIKGKVRPIKVSPNYGTMAAGATGVGILASKKRHKMSKRLRRAGFYVGISGFGLSIAGSTKIAATIAKKAMDVGTSEAFKAASQSGKRRLMEQAMQANKSTLRKAAKLSKYGKIGTSIGMGMWVTGLLGQTLTHPVDSPRKRRK